MSEAVDGAVQGGNNAIESFVEKQVQDMVLCGFRQLTSALVGSNSGHLHFKGAIGFPNMSNQLIKGGSNWTKLEYLKANTRRKRKPEMMRTSAGENFDLQADFPLPPNSTAHQRSLRTRRLNRWRSKRANDLTSNRKALKKIMYVIHVDGSCKPRSIHKHLRKKAVRDSVVDWIRQWTT